MFFSQFSKKFWDKPPSCSSALELYKGDWYRDFDKKSLSQIREELSCSLFYPQDDLYKLTSDLRVRWCSDLWGGLDGMTVVELGPADGYHTFQLEALGANVLSIEGNVDAFLRCLIFKNLMSMRAQFWLGDFLQIFKQNTSYDLLFACGVLYHLQDPLGFLESASQKFKKLFLWTTYYDESNIESIDHEKNGFAQGITSQRILSDGSSFTYYHKFYDIQHISSTGYIGGLNEYACWLTKSDLFRALDSLGYKIIKFFDDPGVKGAHIASINIWLERTEQ